MKLNVNIEYRTSWGEELVLCIGGKRYPLSYAGDGMWIHEAGEATGCVRNHYKNFTKFYRHKKVN